MTMADAWEFDDPSTTLPPEMRNLPGVSEWAAVERRRPRREVYGRVYELITGDPRDGEHPYVGKTIQTIHQRVHSSRNAHTSAPSVAKDPWKARILLGRAGYRLLETVSATGNDKADAAELRRVESFWIDRLRPTHNIVRPVRPPVHEQATLPRRGKAVVRRTPAQIRATRRTRIRVLAFLALAALFTFPVARLVLAMHLPWPQAPWIAAPVVGVTLGWIAFEWLDKRYRKLTGRRR